MSKYIFICLFLFLYSNILNIKADTYIGSVSGVKSENPFIAPNLPLPVFKETVYNIKELGAKGDSLTNDTQLINQVIERCHNNGGGTIYFPAGRYMAASIRLMSNVRLLLNDFAEIYGADSGYESPEPYGEFEKYQDFGHSHFKNALMYGFDIENFSIEGGKITGGHIITGSPKGRDIGDKVIAIVRGKNLYFKGITHDTGGHFVYLLNDCRNITLDHINIKKSRDAIDFMGCSNVRVFGCRFTGCSDDTIGIKSDYILGRRISSSDFYIWNCYFESGCNGLQFGSETTGDFKNIYFWSIKIVRGMKAGIGITSNDSGIIENVFYRDIEITNAACPIFILITKRLRTGEKGVTPGKIKNIIFENITISKQREGKHHGPISTATISGLPGYTIDNIRFINLNMTNAGGGTIEDALVVPPYLPKSYSPNSLKTRPAAGFFIRHAQNISFTNFTMNYEQADYRPTIIAWDVIGLEFNNLKAPKVKGVPILQLKNSKKLKIQNCTPLLKDLELSKIDQINF